MMSFYKTAGRPSDIAGYAQSIIELMDQALQYDLLGASERVSVMDLFREATWIRTLLQNSQPGA